LLLAVFGAGITAFTLLAALSGAFDIYIIAFGFVFQCVALAAEAGQSANESKREEKSERKRPGGD